VLIETTTPLPPNVIAIPLVEAQRRLGIEPAGATAVPG
jgi:hypothetical protein